MKVLIIGSNESGQRLDKFLAKYMPLAPKSFLYKMMRKKNITLNGKKTTGSERLSEGDTIKLFLSDETADKFAGNRIFTVSSGHTLEKLDILYEDANTLFINKPPGMLSQKAAKDDMSLVEYITGYLLETCQISEEQLRTFRPSVCNRLDRNTSGIVSAGKTLAALQELGQMFRERSLKKYYLCLVEGTVTQGAHISGFLKKDRRTNKVVLDHIMSEGASRIETEYRPIGKGENVTLLEVHLITGKTHQIRAHMASVGHPIIGDFKYGSRKINERFQKQYGLTSQLLHSVRLVLPECSGTLAPLSGRTITAPLPELFIKICEDKKIKRSCLQWPHGVQEDSEVLH